MSNEDVAGSRSGILAPEFVPIADATKDLSGYESWSRFCLEQLNVLLDKAAAAGLRCRAQRSSAHGLATPRPYRRLPGSFRPAARSADSDAHLFLERVFRCRLYFGP